MVLGMWLTAQNSLSDARKVSENSADSAEMAFYSDTHEPMTHAQLREHKRITDQLVLVRDRVRVLNGAVTANDHMKAKPCAKAAIAVCDALPFNLTLVHTLIELRSFAEARAKAQSCYSKFGGEVEAFAALAEATIFFESASMGDAKGDAANCRGEPMLKNAVSQMIGVRHAASTLLRMQSLLKRIQDQTALKTKADQQMKAAKYTDAAASYTAAIAAEPRLPQQVAVLHCNKAAALMSLKRFSEALTNTKKALAMQSKYAKALRRQAQCNEALGHPELASHDYALLAKLEPHNAEWHTKGAEMRRMGAQQRARKAAADRQNEQARRHEETRFRSQSRLKQLGKPNYYDILGVTDKFAREAQIRDLFKKKALRCHPDRVTASRKEWAEKQFKMLNEAKDVLLDHRKRRDHDTEIGW